MQEFAETQMNKYKNFALKEEQKIGAFKMSLDQMSEKTLAYKFDVDKVLSSNMWSEKVIKQQRQEITNMLKDIVQLQEHKVDFSEYKDKIKFLEKQLKDVLKVAHTTESSQQTVIEFIDRYEPIYVQR